MQNNTLQESWRCLMRLRGWVVVTVVSAAAICSCCDPLNIFHITCTSLYPHICTSSRSFNRPSSPVLAPPPPLTPPPNYIVKQILHINSLIIKQMYDWQWIKAIRSKNQPDLRVLIRVETATQALFILCNQSIFQWTNSIGLWIKSHDQAPQKVQKSNGEVGLDLYT